MPSHIQTFLFSIFFLHLGSTSPPSPAYYSPSVEAEEEQALMNRLLIDQNFSEGIDYADPKDDRGLHSNTIEKYLYLPFSFQKLSPQMGNFLVAKILPLIGWVPPNPQLFFFLQKMCFWVKNSISCPLWTTLFMACFRLFFNLI